MNKNLEDFIFIILLIILIWITWIFLFFYIDQSQIVLVYRPYPEQLILGYRNEILLIPLTFSFLLLYNYLLRFIIDKKLVEVEWINLLIFLLNIFLAFYFFYLNY